jgi:hypothetical protein
MNNKIKEIFEKKVNVSILDWMGKMRGGVSIMLSLNILKDSYYIIYWIHPNGDFKFVIDEEFLEKFEIDNIYNYPPFKDLKDYIDYKVLPTKEKIWEEFDIKIN